MSRDEALKEAPADPLGRRWATARRYGRLYLTWRDPDGGGGIQLVQRRHGVRRFQQVSEPLERLCWRPVLEIWHDLPAGPGTTAASGG